MRFINRKTITNANENYNDLLENRNLNQITHYSTPNFIYATPQQIQNLSIIEHTWKFEDKFYKLSTQYYGVPTYWWVIALFNKTPSETMIQLGDTIYIPKPLQLAMSILKA